VQTVLAALLVAYLPGTALFRAPVADRWRRADLPADERAFWAVVLSVILSSLVVLALAAVGHYTFGRLLALNAAFTLGIILASRGRLRLDPGSPRPAPTALVPVALVVLGAWLFFPPAEYVIGGKDPGIYMNQGIQIAQRGALVVRDEVVASVPEPSRNLFFPSHGRPEYYGLRFMGFFILDPGAGTVLGQFPHLYPVWIAIGYGLDGLTGARRMIGWWGILGLLAVYFAGARLIGRPAAAAGTALLALNVAQVWFGRYPNAELLMQALLFAALLAFARSHIDQDRFFAPVAATLLALLLLLRVDAVLALGGIAAATAVLLVDGRRPRLSFLLPLALGLTVAGLYLTVLMAPYAALPLVFIRNLTWMHLAMLALLAMTLVALGVAARHRRVTDRLQEAIPTTLVIVTLVAAAYAVFLRTPTGQTAPHDAYALRTFAIHYVTPAGLAAALMGLVVVVRRWFWRDPALLLTATIFSFFFFYKIRIVPEHFWMARRFLPIILPMTLLLAAGAAFYVVQGRSRAIRTLRLIVPFIFLALLAREFAGATRPILGHVEYAGVIPRLEALAGRFEPDALLIVESRNASDLHVLALPLAYIYARNVLVLASTRPERGTFAEFLTWARTRHGEVFFLGGGGTDLLSASVGVVPVGSERFQLPEYHSPRNAYPEGIRQKEFDFGIYRFVDHRETPDRFTLDVGSMDDLHVLRFHAKERLGEETFRWTRDVSYVAITAVPTDARRLTLWLSNGGRPAQASPVEVTVFLENRLLGRTMATPHFEPHTFPIPADVLRANTQEPLRVQLQVTTWNPLQVLGAPDDRQLGVMLSRVELE
jgi:hypothetical protein